MALPPSPTLPKPMGRSSNLKVPPGSFSSAWFLVGAAGALLFAHAPLPDDQDGRPGALHPLVPSLVYDQACCQCHGAEGRGVPPWVGPFPARRMREANSTGWSIAVVLQGCSLANPQAPGGARVMPAMGAWLNDAQIAEALTFVRVGLCGAGSEVSPDAVASWRGRAGGRREPWTRDAFHRTFGGAAATLAQDDHP